MSTNASASGPEVSDHAVQRYIQRTDFSMVTAAELSYRFSEGYKIDIRGKDYTEARLTQDSGVPIVLLRQHTHLATVVYAREETIIFRDASPCLECKNCGMVEPSTDMMTECVECGANDWMIIDPTQ